VLVSPEDEESLAMTIIELLRDPGRRREMGMAARKEAEGHFTIERMAQETIEAYRKII
jgi:glycosyltransferase involved in cell wall biosynthesis